MKLKVDLSPLFNCIKQMGITDPNEMIKITLNSTKGLEISLSELKILAPYDLLGYQLDDNTYIQVLLFIPDHSYKEDFSQVVSNPAQNGNKYHIANCETLKKMRQNNRFNRYQVTNNHSGLFHIFGRNNQNAEVRLNVCKNCLKQLNYKNYNSNQHYVFQHFNLKEFFEEYHSYLGQLPQDVGQDKGGYSYNWKQISDEYKSSQNYCCEECGVYLADYPYLLHTHHRDGVKQNNHWYNLKAVCVECHTREPLHEHMIVDPENINLLNKLRSIQQ